MIMKNVFRIKWGKNNPSWKNLTETQRLDDVLNFIEEVEASVDYALENPDLIRKNASPSECRRWYANLVREIRANGGALASN